MITVVGLGFVGLTTALGFCEKGFNVYGYDIDKEKIKKFESGIVPFYEPYLEDKLNKYKNNNFKLSHDLKEAVNNSKIIFLCVGTPSNNEGSVDLSFLFSAIKNTVNSIDKKDYKILVIKSTVPPSTTSYFLKPYIEKLGFKVGEDIGLANNPEFLRESYAWEDFLYPDRIVIGYEDSKSVKIVEDIYKPFNSQIFKVSLNSAEYIKYLSNTLLATLISFANEQSMIGKSIGDIDIKKSFQILHLDKRWNGNPANMTSYVFPGCGFGGYCLPKDTNALINHSLKNFYKPEILQSVLKVNRQIKEHIIKEIMSKVNTNEYIGILGLSFKPNSDDVRDTPANEIIKLLIENGYNKIIAYDPLAIDTFKKTYNFHIDYGDTLKDVLDKVSHIVILTAWDDFIECRESIAKKNVFDYRYIFD
ncbi:UDPglucose 6-dehydrogenase [Bacillus tianshenii]|uniref:UDP-glucose 6-dehydrogenase n=1 Tax=Sutcliffiella tianshenii TaxID=1463404 RepID=A0ABS2P701_9BACI|nr:nucleotide sugar dehydrogenase [Bacillus tianshenii]MBM7622190.1 UDPglucose 6-dehydrogenase [Bacillus tianshenii]